MPKVRLEFVRKSFAAGRMDGLVRLMAQKAIEEDILTIVKEGHEKYIESWETDLSKPEFYIGFDYEGAHTFMGYVAMEAEGAEDATLSVWQLLDRDQGTAVRFMQISKDWKSKTWPIGSFPSNAGAGRTTGLGPPQEGIESRHIAETVAEEVMPDPDIEGIYEHAMRVAFASR